MLRGGKFGWFLGLVFGTLFGFLFAPRKGKELRDRIKADRKKGKLGIAPIQDDLKHLGQEIAAIAKDFYYSEAVQDIVERGRSKVKGLSDELVDEVTDFHKTRIAPFKREIGSGVKEWHSLKRKVNKSTKIGKHAIKEIKSVMKKKKS